MLPTKLQLQREIVSTVTHYLLKFSDKEKCAKGKVYGVFQVPMWAKISHQDWKEVTRRNLEKSQNSHQKPPKPPIGVFSEISLNISFHASNSEWKIGIRIKKWSTGSKMRVVQNWENLAFLAIFSNFSSYGLLAAYFWIFSSWKLLQEKMLARIAKKLYQHYV